MLLVMGTSPILKLISLTLLLALFPAAMALVPPLEEQAGALLAWKATLQSHPAQLQSWARKNNTARPCSWYGIKCSKHQATQQEVITEISLSGLQLRGKLETLNFTVLRTLTAIQLSNNQIRGSFPHALASSLPNLRHLMLQNNKLSGAIPRQIKHLEGHVSLNMSFNYLFGPIPTELGYLNKLVRLDFSSNNLRGPIPRNFMNFTKLTILYLDGNQFSGYIPLELGYLVNLQELALSKNKLMGSIPETFGGLINLIALNLWDNQLSGFIPRELGYLVNLIELCLDNNKLMGSIPDVFGNLTKLTMLHLYGNQFTGYIPLGLGSLVNLEDLQLHSNKLSGPLPPQLCTRGQLKLLTASNNNLNGQFLSSLVQCRSLVRVRLENNKIEGAITDLGVYPNLVYMDMSSNRLSGQLSFRWRGCHNLTMLRISNNNLTGKIPAIMGELSELRVLDLSANKLKGELPSSLGNLTNLFNLSLADNLLHGSIPQEIGALYNLEWLYLSSNSLSGTIHGSINNCFKLRLLNLSHNNFRGRIPTELGVLYNLAVLLDLSDNYFDGPIPSQLSGLIMLDTLNLSHNELNSSIPSSFWSMESLTSIDLSYNELEGPVPENKLFKGAPVMWFMHNKMLCGLVKGLRPCSSATQSRWKRKGYKTLVLVVVPVLISLVLITSMLMFRHERKKSKGINTSEVTQAKVFSIWSFDGANMFKEIAAATNNFSEVHCIGTGGYGSVYKARLATCEIFAVKRIHMMEDECCMNELVFNREIEALVHIRHRNIVNLVGYCSSSQGRFLIYEYMERGDLAGILRVDGRAIELGWRRRINIVLDVVHALAYLHHDCSSPILHRDITSKNILLDREFRACISDFGTSKILNAEGQNITRLAGTKGYLAPELAYTVNVTEKCDIYSFGVLVLELFMGSHPGDLLSSLSMATKNTVVCLQDLLDSRLALPDAKAAREVYCILSVAVQCLDLNPSCRPTARRANDDLSAIKACEDHVDYLYASLTLRAQ